MTCEDTSQGHTHRWINIKSTLIQCHEVKSGWFSFDKSLNYTYTVDRSSICTEIFHGWAIENELSTDRRVVLTRVVLEEALMLPAIRVVFPEEPDDLFATTTTSTRIGTDARRRMFTAVVTYRWATRGHVVTRLDYNNNWVSPSAETRHWNFIFSMPCYIQYL